MTIKPLPGYCLIEPIEEESTSAGGVYLPDSAKDKPSRGSIVALSPVILIEARDALILDFKDKPLMPTLTSEYQKLSVGSIVIYKKWNNQEVQDEGKTYLLVPFSDLLAIIE